MEACLFAALLLLVVLTQIVLVFWVLHWDRKHVTYYQDAPTDEEVAGERR
jgi:hypothetical protein